MGSKSILLLGALAGSAIAYFCIQNNKELFTPEKPQTVVETQHEETVAHEPQKQNIEEALAAQPKQPPEEEKKADLKEPSYLYENGEHPRLVINANTKDETAQNLAIADKYCNEEGCVREISFSDEIARAPWLEQAKKITAFLAVNKIANGSVSITEKTVNISGDFDDEAKKVKFSALIKPLEAKGFKIIDHTTFVKPKEESVIEEPRKEEVKIETVEVKIPREETIVQPEPVKTEEVEPSPEVSIDQSQKTIDDILSASPIYFKRNSNEISAESKKILDKIIDIVNQNTQTLSLKVAGHTDASGKASYNKWLSEQRAKAVKDYLINKNIKAANINAVGYGEERPVMADPYDKKNRRVTIEIKEGE